MRRIVLIVVMLTLSLATLSIAGTYRVCSDDGECVTCTEICYEELDICTVQCH
jgi:hypothetical protein